MLDGNMALSLQPYKGARDFYPADKRLQKYLFHTMRRVVEHFGYEEYDAPMLEPLELYLAKTSEEIVHEQTYVFRDRGGRDVVIRPEMTPSVSRMVAARRQELAYPLRLYSIPNLWRYERPQRGRLREHWQLNVDLFGVEGVEAEHEMLILATELLSAFGAKASMYSIRVNSRKLTKELFTRVLELSDVEQATIARLLDKKDKLTEAEFVSQAEAVFSPSAREAGKPARLFELLKAQTVEDLPESIRHNEGVEKLRQLRQLSNATGIHNIAFDIALMRGFDYYTDIVFEVFDNDPANRRSLFGGGRYDGLVAQFGVEPIATVGFGVGDVILTDFLATHNLLPDFSGGIDAAVILIGNTYLAAQPLLHSLRKHGLNLSVDMTNRKPAVQIKHAVKRGLPYVIFVGESELKDGRFTLKDLRSGEEQQLSPERLVSTMKDYRKNDRH